MSKKSKMNPSNSAKKEEKKEEKKVVVPNPVINSNIPDMTPEAEEVSGTVEEIATSEVENTSEDTQVALLSKLATCTIPDNMQMNASDMIRLLDVSNRRFASKKDDQLVITANAVLDDVNMYLILLSGINMLQQGKVLGINIPMNHYTEYFKRFSDWGIALPPGKINPEDPSQIQIPFSDSAISKDVKEAAKEEIKRQTSEKPSIEVKDWKSDEDAEKGLLYVLGDTLAKDNRLKKALNLYKEYRLKDPKNKDKYSKSNYPELMDELLKFVGTKKCIFLNGIGGSVYSATSAKHTCLIPHMIMKRHFPDFKEEDIAEIVKVIIKYNAALRCPDTKLEDNIAWKALSESTLNELLLYPTKAKDIDKEIMGRMYSCYKDKLGQITEPDYNYKATSIMIDIANLYLSKDKAISHIKFKEYEAKVNEALNSEATEKK